MLNNVTNGPQDSTHPMDSIEVRRLQFRFDKLSPEHVLWSQSCPIFSVFANALNLHVPYFEHYLIRAMVAAKYRVTEKKLRDDIQSIIGQEGQHAYSFLAFNHLMRERYPKAQAFEDSVKLGFDRRLKQDSFKSMIGFTAGYETFTFLAGMIFLDNYEKWFEHSNPTIKAMWIWHQVEEVEHAAVAFDVYKHFYPDDENYRRKMVFSALIHIVKETWHAYWHMCQVEGFVKSPILRVKSALFLFSVLGKMVWNARPVLSKNYHPSTHPFATSKQSPIALSWRRFHQCGGDVLAIDRKKMASIMNLDYPEGSNHV